LPDVDVGLGEPKTTSAGGPNLGFSYPSYSSTFRDNYNHLNAVSTQRLMSTRPLTYLVAYRLPGSRQRPVGQILACIRLMLTQPKALTDTDTVASTPSEAPWDEVIIPPPQPVAEPQGVSARHSSTRLILTLTPLQDHFACTPAAVATHSYTASAWHFEQGSFDGLTPPYADDDGGIMRRPFDFASIAGAAS
jgi:hypothetical protein